MERLKAMWKMFVRSLGELSERDRGKDRLDICANQMSPKDDYTRRSWD